MFWQTRRNRDAADSAKEREAFLRRLREVLEPYSKTPEPAELRLAGWAQRPVSRDGNPA